MPPAYSSMNKINQARAEVVRGLLKRCKEFVKEN
jgi:hypothetical protein